jgi:LysR family transcriptional regulator, glycine cleavage system transcriptional activator
MVQDIRFPSIDGLRAFEASARLGSFDRASDELAISASAVAKRVATVEDLLGTALFARGTKPLQLTPSGKEYLEQVDGALRLLAAMPLHRRAAQRRERLRVLAPPTFARQILAPQLASFSAAQPQVELELQLSVPYADAAVVQADVEVRYGEVDAQAPQVLLREQVLPLAAPALLQQLPPLLQPADLAQAPLLRTPLQPWAPWFRAAALDWPEPTQGPKLLDLGLLLEAAVSGQGIALARPSLARHWLAAGSLLPVLRLRAWPAQHYHLLTHGQGSAVQAFADWLHAQCRRQQAEAEEELSRHG